MSIYIKGMEMPKSCDKCRISFNIGRSEYLCQLLCDPNPCVEGGEFWRECGEGADEKRPNWCPLIELPPHGRLIDADALYERAASLDAQALDYVGKLTERDGDEISIEWKIWSAILAERTAFRHDVFDAPTIIEAEVDE